MKRVSDTYLSSKSQCSGCLATADDLTNMSPGKSLDNFRLVNTTGVSMAQLSCAQTNLLQSSHKETQLLHYNHLTASFPGQSG